MNDPEERVASKAEQLAASWGTNKARIESKDLERLPDNVAEAILAVEEASWGIHERVQEAEALWETAPDSPEALEPGGHSQSEFSQRFELVGDEVVEVVKDSAEEPVRLVYRPDLRPT